MSELGEMLVRLWDAAVDRIGLPMTVAFAIIALILFSGAVKITGRFGRKE